MSDHDASTELDVFHCPLDGIRLIEASAGTGKTWAICGLVLRLLLERGWTVQQVLVVTFTEAATAELRERIRSRLAEVLAAVQPGAAAADDPFITALLARLRGELGQTDAALAQRLDLALHSFDEASIFTIHGFCQRALADAPFSAGAPMATEVLQDDAELRDDAVKAAWRAEVSGADLPPALAATLLQRGDTPQRWSQLLRRMAGRPLARRRWPAALDQAGTLPAADTAGLEAAYNTAAARWGSEREAIVERLQASLSQLNATTYKPDAVLRGAAAWDAWFAHADALASLDKNDLASLALYTRGRLTERTKANCITPAHAFFDEADALFGLRAETVQALALARAWLLRRVLEHAETALRRHKRERGLVAFDDMLFNLYERLHDRADPSRALALATTLRSRYPAALIDEFQDTDPLQFAIFRRLYGAGTAPDADAADRASAATTATATTLFLVGDPKQAIYSFRNADLPTYLQARALADAHYSLAHNQRSTPGLIDALNRLFTRHPHAFMQAGLLYRPVQAGAKPRSVLIDQSAPNEAHRRAALQLWRIPEDEEDGLPPLRATAHGLALQATAAEIARLLQQAQQGHITLDARPLRAGDIAVLVRSHGQGAEVRRALAARGVRSVELSQASVYHSPEAEDLARVLMAVLHPARERLLRAALASELFGRDAQALEAATHLADGLTPEMLRFGAYRDTWIQRGVGVMLRQMMVGERLAARLLTLPHGERRLTNWLHLGEALHQAEAAHPAPQALLRWFERQRSDETVTDASQQRLESDQNLVQIVTIHKSKGLEYPFVFCPFLWIGQHPAVGSGELLAYHDDSVEVTQLGSGDCDGSRSGIGDRPASTLRLDFRAGLDPDCDTDAIKRRLALDDAAENLRLVYVALTRAVHRCMLVVGCSASAIRGGKSLNRGSHSLLNWLVAGTASSPAEWLSAKPPQTTPAAVTAAWQALADATTGAEPAPISLVDLSNAVAGAAAHGVALVHDALPPVHSLTPPARLPAGWSIGSYSMMLSRGGAGSGGQPGAAGAVEVPDQAAIDHDGRSAMAGDAANDGNIGDADISETELAEEQHVDDPFDDDDGSNHTGDDASPRQPADDILRFPRGAEAGQCIHQVFEHIDFRDPSGWPAAVDAALSGLPGTDAADRPALAAMLMHMLRDVCATIITPGLQLRDVPRSQRLNEVEFHLSAPALSAETLNRTLARLGYPTPPLGFGRLQGTLRGFIDLVFEHQGRTYVLDWKSNHLGSKAADYRPAACAQAMADQGYHLQSLIYGLALDRLLRLRRADYRPEVHFGGVFYLFVRGVRPGWTGADGRPCGVYFDRPSPAALQRFAAAFDQGEQLAPVGAITGGAT